MGGFFEGTRKGGNANSKPESQQSHSQPLASGPAAESRDVLGDEQTVRAGSQPDTRIDRSQDPMAKPIVGWLVVVAGPLRGKDFGLSYGQNRIGRGTDTDVRLDLDLFVGDNRGQPQNKIVDGEISRLHCIVTYDQENRRFYIQQHPESTNLTYLEDPETGNPEPILMPSELKDRTTFKVGGTKLLFVALCGGDFDWKETPKG